MIVMLIGCIAKGQWQQCNGPFGGQIKELKIKGDTIFALKSNGLYFTINDGNNWTQFDSLPQNYIFDKFFICDNYYIVKLSNKIYYTSNLLINWTLIDIGNPNIQINSVIIKDSNFYAATNNGLFISSDNGNNWIQTNYNSNVMSLIKTDSCIIAGCYGGIIHRSFNNGISWDTIYISSSPISFINSFEKEGNIIYAATSNGIFVSQNNGYNWSVLGLANMPMIFSIKINGNYIFAETFSDVFVSTDNGLNWSSIDSLFYGNVDNINSIVSSGNNFFAAISDKGVFQTIDQGINWIPKNNGLIISGYNNDLIINSNYIYSAYDADIFLSKDMGNSWSSQTSGFHAGDGISTLASKDNFVLVGTYLSGLSTQIIGDSVWNLMNSGLMTCSGCKDIKSIFVDNNNIFLGTYGGVFLSSNNGLNWTNANSGIPANELVNCFASSGNNMYAGTFSGNFYTTSDNGNNWTIINTSLPPYSGFSSIIVNGNEIIAGTFRGAYISSDSGISWSGINNGLTDSIITALLKIDLNIFAATEKGIYLTNNNGANWIPIGLANYFIESLAKDSLYLYAITRSKGIWKRPLSDFVGINETTQNTQLHLYPNPANNTLTLNLSQLQKLQNTTVSIYDIQSKQLLHQNISEVKTQLDISVFAKGIYIIKVQSDKEILQSKFVKN